MRILLDHGANVHGLPHGEELDEEGRLPRGDSPLHYSAINGSVPCVQMLLALQADVNRTSARYGETPLHKAVLFGRTEVARLLIQAGAALEHKNDRGFSALKLCELCGGPEMLAVFAEEGAPVQAVTATSITQDFAEYDSNASEEVVAAGERLLWDLVVGLYLYKRPRRARALLVQCLLAAYRAQLPGLSPSVASFPSSLVSFSLFFNVCTRL
jgi:ankyrin repeat protein